MQEIQLIDTLTQKMFAFNCGDAKRIQHLMKVHRFAQLIGHLEQLDAHTQFILECAALVHDIGIRPAEQKYHACSGKLQEQEGPAYARPMLTALGLEAADVERICYLVGHHHTYQNIDGLDYQILVEADFLVNFYEDGCDRDTIQTAMHNIFRTASGQDLCRTLYLSEGGTV